MKSNNFLYKSATCKHVRLTNVESDFIASIKSNINDQNAVYEQLLL